MQYFTKKLELVPDILRMIVVLNSFSDVFNFGLYKKMYIYEYQIYKINWNVSTDGSVFMDCITQNFSL